MGKCHKWNLMRETTIIESKSDFDISGDTNCDQCLFQEITKPVVLNLYKTLYTQ